MAVHMDEWEEFILSQPRAPFLQSWTMGEVYRSIGEEPVRMEERGDDGAILGICQAITVPARRGKHLAVMYGPVGQWSNGAMEQLKNIARERGCAFIRISPFWTSGSDALKEMGFRPSPLHMLAEHVWCLDLRGKSEEEILMGMRNTTRNLTRRAEREGVTVEASKDPVRDLPIFFALYEETRKRHHFVPYPESFIRAQVEHFVPRGECRLYIARFNGEPVAASVHMIYGGETSYHHGASTTKYPKCFASHLLQWRAVQDAIRRGDRVYNFWGVAPTRREESGKWIVDNEKHPFAGVTTFKTGFGGELLELVHCMDLPVSRKYWFTWGIEMVRKWRRGF